ncbi:hypothetical protein [Aestuariispira ectoiniformans]|uniref:hypothetical protein n=1 Tax=Aestuariispira ectoiniformans TaxID=2775080 RepID=UPI00223A7AA3|nr:hypothetical protein [Aestuariispira ectoiniformans]
MTTDDKTIDYEKVLLDPTSMFVSPEALLADENFSIPQKIELLRRWEYDVCEVDVAEEEGMPVSDKEENMLERILTALDALGAEVDTDHTPPTKHGGIDLSK